MQHPRNIKLTGYQTYNTYGDAVVISIQYSGVLNFRTCSPPAVISTQIGNVSLLYPQNTSSDTDPMVVNHPHDDIIH